MAVNQSARVGIELPGQLKRGKEAKTWKGMLAGLCISVTLVPLHPDVQYLVRRGKAKD